MLITFQCKKKITKRDTPNLKWMKKKIELKTKRNYNDHTTNRRDKRRNNDNDVDDASKKNKHKQTKKKRATTLTLKRLASFIVGRMDDFEFFPWGRVRVCEWMWVKCL